MSFTINHETIETDGEGYLCRLNDWNREVAIQIAKSEKIELTEQHWEIIYFLRDFYQEYQLTPVMRITVKEFAKQVGKEKSTSPIFMRLFSGTPLRVATKIAGLPKPTHCL